MYDIFCSRIHVWKVLDTNSTGYNNISNKGQFCFEQMQVCIESEAVDQKCTTYLNKIEQSYSRYFMHS